MKKMGGGENWGWGEIATKFPQIIKMHDFNLNHEKIGG